jgi:RHS repeat-associated protein
MRDVFFGAKALPVHGETVLPLYGARYLDPRTSQWISADPALGEYLPSAPINDDARKRNQNLPGMGGVFNLVNMQLYHYAGNNPVRYVDPDGNFATIAGAVIGGAAGGISAMLQGKEIGSKGFWAGVLGGATNGAIVGLAIDISAATFGAGTPAAVALVTAGGTVGGGVGSIVETNWNGERIRLFNVAVDALIGGVAAFAGNRIGRAVANRFENALTRSLNNPAGKLYQLVHSNVLNGVNIDDVMIKAMNTIKGDHLLEVLSSRGIDAGVSLFADVLQDLLPPPKIDTP